MTAPQYLAAYHVAMQSSIVGNLCVASALAVVCARVCVCVRMCVWASLMQQWHLDDEANLVRVSEADLRPRRMTVNLKFLTGAQVLAIST